MVNTSSTGSATRSSTQYLEPLVSLHRTYFQEMQHGLQDMQHATASVHTHLPPQEHQREYLRYRSELLASLWTAQQQQHASAAALQSMYAQQPGLQPSYSTYTFSNRQHHDITAHRTPSPSLAHPTPRRSEPHHRVYVLRCSHCDSFLSDRGMRAVLLLKPHITLFSTDVAPVNCGPLYGSQDDEPDCAEEKVERTCECLTQSLGCFSCGNTVGCRLIGLDNAVQVS